MTTWTPQTKNTTTWAGISKNVASFSNIAKTLVHDFLLKEDGGYLLLETGDKIILEQSTGTGVTWSNQSKS